METDKNFLLKVVKDILDGKNPDNALNQLKEQLTALGYVPEYNESKIQNFYNIDVHFKKENCAFQCKYNKWRFFTRWTVRMLDDSL